MTQIFHSNQLAKDKQKINIITLLNRLRKKGIFFLEY